MEEEALVFEPEEPEVRIVGLYGEIDDENSKELIGALVGYTATARHSAERAEPVEMIVSTGGGNVADMFAIYDIMRMSRELYDISTLGIGKVMSAGLLLLAAGTPGQRRIGKHCRVMLHHVVTGDQGSLADVRSTCKEAEAMETLMFDAIAAETNLTIEQMREIIQDNTDKFFSAEEAIEMGIADIIV